MVQFVRISTIFIFACIQRMPYIVLCLERYIIVQCVHLPRGIEMYTAVINVAGLRSLLVMVTYVSVYTCRCRNFQFLLICKFRVVHGYF